jgi:hypothetical protein
MTDIPIKKRRSCRKTSARGALASRARPALKAAEKIRDQRQETGANQPCSSRQRKKPHETARQAKPRNHPAALKSP